MLSLHKQHTVSKESLVHASLATFVLVFIFEQYRHMVSRQRARHIDCPVTPSESTAYDAISPRHVLIQAFVCTRTPCTAVPTNSSAQPCLHTLHGARNPPACSRVSRLIFHAGCVTPKDRGSWAPVSTTQSASPPRFSASQPPSASCTSLHWQCAGGGFSLCGGAIQ